MSDIIVPQSDVKLCTRNVNLYYGENHALKDINLDIKTNKITAFIGPSGCGKSTIIGDIMDRGELDLQFSVSATNRKPREGEVDGVSYHFLSDRQFKDLIAEGAFVEYEQVYPGRFYGTLRSEIQNRVDSGHNVILDIDVKGGVNVKRQFGSDAVSIFIDRKSTRLNSSHPSRSRMPSSA